MDFKKTNFEKSEKLKIQQSGCWWATEVEGISILLVPTSQKLTGGTYHHGDCTCLRGLCNNEQVTALLLCSSNVALRVALIVTRDSDNRAALPLEVVHLAHCSLMHKATNFQHNHAMRG